MSLAPVSQHSPVIKVGAVILRGDGAVFILQPIPKNAGELPPFVLARGSRQYQDAQGQWQDARDVATGERHAATLEPFARTLAREIEEEAGVSAAQLAAAKVSDLGVMDFQSRSKGVYPIQWFVVRVDDATAQAMGAQMPVEALAVRWATLAEIEAMAVRGEFSAGYVPVIKAALRAPH